MTSFEIIEQCKLCVEDGDELVCCPLGARHNVKTTIYLENGCVIDGLIHDDCTRREGSGMKETVVLFRFKDPHEERRVRVNLMDIVAIIN